jgi:hypothetical protein
MIIIIMDVLAGRENELLSSSQATVSSVELDTLVELDDREHTTHFPF